MERKRKSVVVEPYPLVCCLPGRENVMPEQGILRKLTRKFYHKSGTELRLELEQRIKLLPTLKNY
jgi:hypothetical protein